MMNESIMDGWMNEWINIEWMDNERIDNEWMDGGIDGK